MTEPQQTQQEFLEHLFFDEYCDECGGDAEHHIVLGDFPFPSTYFAQCQFPPNEETGEYHPTIAAFRKAKEEKTA